LGIYLELGKKVYDLVNYLIMEQTGFYKPG